MRKLTIVVVPPNAVGHVNACSGALSQLVPRGHRMIFVLEKAFKGKLSPLGYEEFIYSCPMKHSSEDANESKENPGEKMAQMMLRQKIIGPFSPLEKKKGMVNWMDDQGNRNEFKVLNEAIESAIREYKPDLFFVDGFFYPAVHFSGIPWISNISVTPQYASELALFDNTDIPPGGSGLPTNDKSEWNLFEEVRQQAFNVPRLNNLIVELGYEAIEGLTKKHLATQVMTVYAYPEELNYQQFRDEGWFNLEVFNKSSLTNRVELNTVIPEKFLRNTFDGQFSGKLIYVSMGSMGSVDLDLMNRLIATLGKTNHKYIVSKGPRFSEYQLAENMWGDRFLPQTKIVSHVDLVITHGGNNTMTETFAEGKPMIVLPLFADQFDNAQRLKETGFGARIDPNNFTESELIGKIDRLLNDGHLKQKLQNAAKRIQLSHKHEDLAIKIEQMYC